MKSVDWLTISPGSSLIKISFPKVAEVGYITYNTYFKHLIVLST